jgi:rubrerythrin
VLNYLICHDRLSDIEAKGQVKRLCKGPELEAYHMLAVQWREQSSKHVLKPEVFKQVLDFNAGIRALQEERDGAIAVYCQDNKISYQDFQKAYGLLWVEQLRVLRDEEKKLGALIDRDKKPYCGNCGHAPLIWKDDGSGLCPECGTVDESFQATPEGQADGG